MKYSGIIGIHGTNAPQLLSRFPRAFSHGCTRLHNRDITWQYFRCPIGTPVWNVR
jgi:lipoprotein-anchoring transpeptidase ErfK/SrfK